MKTIALVIMLVFVVGAVNGTMNETITRGHQLLDNFLKHAPDIIAKMKMREGLVSV